MAFLSQFLLPTVLLALARPALAGRFLPGAPPPSNTSSVEVLSWEPRAFRFRSFLTAAECDYLIAQGKPHMAKSTVVDSNTGESIPSEVRTSSGTFLVRGMSDVTRAIEKKISLYTGLPAENGEGLQILHYQRGEKYEPHFDYFQDTHNTENGGQRLATVLMYLTDVDQGGETVFPLSTDKPNLGNRAFSECAQRGVAIKPRKGDALFFFSLQPTGVTDTKSIHAGCPVIKCHIVWGGQGTRELHTEGMRCKNAQGEKWSATKWIRVNTYAAPTS